MKASIMPGHDANSRFGPLRADRAGNENPNPATRMEGVE